MSLSRISLLNLNVFNKTIPPRYGWNMVKDTVSWLASNKLYSNYVHDENNFTRVMRFGECFDCHKMLDVENICRTIGRNQWTLWTNCCLFGSSFKLYFTCKECENNRKWCIRLWLIIRARSVFDSSTTTRRLNYWSTCTTQQIDYVHCR
jgi:hypothetical protein